jgi:hypothetical protein
VTDKLISETRGSLSGSGYGYGVQLLMKISQALIRIKGSLTDRLILRGEIMGRIGKS